ncbi:MULTISPECIES: antitoxin Xre/MbcA/ParS toxin-binding domain-containing protein [unclassified Rhodococcus (in: high G+C Gram-positive bacteria)]|uniref:antitoxin Xre/MbcA/ParS toxin-binding domain-containing protein n=1 Tax=unclassified Rhodococcus (in: high G+C Gram-positive bacteria) TaxID=192944 RepID=UPI0013C5656B|nr:MULTISPECIES: antitoxin Xre/MbcA/ParS toxin-binding domain-containing protein [unclassified Rhodococcus (in: high G+C Gram-positive bacteria)]KAF0966621.1 hypothetical protein MLGJGCBP_00213 [Rhodococcus sp. T7]
MASARTRETSAKAAATKKAAERTARTIGHAGSAPRAADDPLSAERVRYLTGEFGGAQLAAIVGVNRSQPSRWIKGQERPGPGAAPLLIDLEHVLARARLVWGETAARTWLESANTYLDGARPLEVLQLSGPAPVLEALDAEAWGGAA